MFTTQERNERLRNLSADCKAQNIGEKVNEIEKTFCESRERCEAYVETLTRRELELCAFRIADVEDADTDEELKDDARLRFWIVEWTSYTI